MLIILVLNQKFPENLSRYVSSISILQKKVSDVIKLSIGGTVVFVGINFYFKNEKFYDTWVMPIFHSVDPETAHNLAVMAAKYNLVPEAKLKESKLLVS